MAFATINADGQISVPPEILRSLGIAAGDRVEFVELEPGKLLVLAANKSVTELKGLFGQAPKAVSIDEMNRAIKACGSDERRIAGKLQELFSTPERARNTILKTALTLGTLGFCILMLALLLGR
jgi:bifunctional DNA-binding transcriptional regulator/antitoxin component of YhaV-PrlF toxin-antitoxin module